MIILVTRKTVGSQPEKRLVYIFHDDPGLLGRRNLLTVVALGAFEREVFSGKPVSRQSVVEGYFGRRPPNHFEVAAGVFGVTTRAVYVALGAVNDSRVISLVVFQSFCDVHVTRQTLQLWTSQSNCVTFHALKRAF